MRSVGVVLVVALATLLHAAGWSLMHERVSPPDVVGQLASVSFSPIAAGNAGEIETAIELAKHHRNIDSIIVGNETLYRSSVLNRGETVPDLIAKIQRVKRQVSVPVTTAEVWNIWLEHPELASAVDYLAVHILPYWEGIPSSAAVDHAMKIYELLRQTYPGKRIVIAEFGWPSAGLNRHDAVPDPVAQAQIIRDFVTRADAM